MHNIYIYIVLVCLFVVVGFPMFLSPPRASEF